VPFRIAFVALRALAVAAALEVFLACAFLGAAGLSEAGFLAFFALVFLGAAVCATVDCDSVGFAAFLPPVFLAGFAVLAG